MPLLPQPYPDEVIGSVIERACYHSGLPMKRIVQSLFGPTRSYASFLMGSKLPQLEHHTGIDAEELLMRHTIYPYAVAYMSANLHAKLKTKALRPKEKECIGSLTKNVSRGVPTRRFCRLCFAEDMQKFGESYWRRSHLLPGVYVCSVHQHDLVETTVQLNDNVHACNWVLPQDITHTTVPIQLSRQTAFAMQEMSVAALNALVMPQKDWPAVYKKIALQKGYRLASGDVAAMRLSNDIFAFFGREFLNSIGCAFPPLSRNPWPRLMVRPGLEPSYSSVKHIMLNAFFFLNDSIKSEFPYRKPGKPPRDFNVSDHDSAQKMESYLNSKAVTGKRFTVREILEEIGVWQLYRHNRDKYPLLSQKVQKFRASNLSERQIGLRPYWRERLKSRIKSDSKC